MPEMIAPFISRQEYQCSHCGNLPPGLRRGSDGEWPVVFQALFTRFQSLREDWGRAIPITSGYRCSEHEKEVSGLTLSVHGFGLALDLGIPIAEHDAFMRLIDNTCPELRVGVNAHPGSVHYHIDTGFYISPIYSLSLITGARWTE